MGKHKNGRQLSVWISDELYKECEQNRKRGQREINKTDYVIAALEFYNKHLKDETTMEYISENVLGELYNKLQNMEDKICKKITTSVIEPDKMRAVLKMSYDIGGKIFLKNIFSYASDIDYKNLDCCSCEITSAEYIGRGDFFLLSHLN